MSKSIYAALLLAGGTLALSACGEEAKEEPSAKSDADALQVTNARLVLPPVAGNPAAVYFDLANKGERGVAVRKAEVKGAGKTELHGTMEWSGKMEMSPTGPQTVPAGGTLVFEPGGLHVMAFDLAPDLAAGGTTAMTLTVAGGQTTTVTVPIQAAGDDR